MSSFIIFFYNFVFYLNHLHFRSSSCIIWQKFFLRVKIVSCFLVGSVKIHHTTIFSSDSDPLVERYTCTDEHTNDQHNEQYTNGDWHDYEQAAGERAMFITDTLVSHMRYHQTGQVSHLLQIVRITFGVYFMHQKIMHCPEAAASDKIVQFYIGHQ